MKVTVLDLALGLVTAVFVVAFGLTVRDRLGIHRPKNAPRPRPHRPTLEQRLAAAEPGELVPIENVGDEDLELEPITVCGSWPINKGDRVRILITVPEYGTEIGHCATCEAIWPGDDVQFRFRLDNRYGRDAIITFFEHELWQLERIPS